MSRYPFAWDLFFRLVLQVPTGRRSLAADCALLASRIEPPPIVEGLCHIPTVGPVVVAANHYQRRGLWIAWPGMVITLALAERRKIDPPVHWLVSGGLQAFQWKAKGPEVPLTRALFRSVARIYGMTALPVKGSGDRAAAIRQWLRWTEKGHALGIFPEGLAGRDRRLGRPEPGFAGLCRLFAAKPVPVLPCGIYERDDVLHIRFGPCLPSGETEDRVMSSIAALLPVQLRGDYSDVTTPPLRVDRED